MLNATADQLAVAAALIELGDDAAALRHIKQLHTTLGAGIGAANWAEFARAVEVGLAPLLALASRTPEARRSLIIEVLENEQEIRRPQSSRKKSAKLN